MNLIKGLHHITALTSDAQKNLDFYAGILGLRFVKRTINYDAPDIYHLYYGDESGSPGSVLTFFPYPGMRKGKKGNGQATVISFSVNENALDYWSKRLSFFNVNVKGPRQRYWENYLSFEDYDGLSLELVATADDDRKGYDSENIPPEYEIKGFYSVLLKVDNYDDTANFLASQMDYSLIAEDENRFRFGTEKRYGYVDLEISTGEPYGLNGSGSVHHVAFATENDDSQSKFRSVLLENGTVSPTEVIDRQYFKSVYFREPGGVLFEVATMNPGFTIDESADELGQKLMLPPWVEKNRSRIEANLPELNLDTEKYRHSQPQVQMRF